MHKQIRLNIINQYHWLNYFAKYSNILIIEKISQLRLRTNRSTSDTSKKSQDF